MLGLTIRPAPVPPRGADPRRPVENPADYLYPTAARQADASGAEGRGVEPPRPGPCHCFRNRVPPANEAYLPGRRGSGSNAGEVALGLRLASEHLPSRSTLQLVTSPSPPRATTRSRPGDLSRTRAALFPLSYGGVASPTGLEPVASAVGGQRSFRLSYDETGSLGAPRMQSPLAGVAAQEGVGANRATVAL